MKRSRPGAARIGIHRAASRWLSRLALLFVGLSASGSSAFGLEVVTYDWPTAPGEAVLSDKYAVRITSGGETRQVEVLMSTSWTEPGGGPDVFRDRTFSWAAFSSDFERPVIIEVEKLFGEGTRDIEVFPSGYNVSRFPSEDGRSVTFVLRRSRYLSVNFKSSDNLKAPGGVVRHMLMVFADPMEVDVPDRSGPGTIVFDSSTTQVAIDAASTVWFDPGFYDLKQNLPDGILMLTPDKTFYLSGGAFLAGKIDTATSADRCVIRGRGAVSGRDTPWEPGQPISALIEAHGEGVVIEGIFAFDNNMHGIVPGDSAALRNVKVWGWHYNNDGFRPWGGTVDHCFARPADDAFYVGGNDLVVTDTVVWQSFNGAVVTCGWGSPEKPYNTSGFRMRDSHVLYPEWNGVGNNNGIIASQLPYNATSDDIHFERIRVDGNISALTNLKRNSTNPKLGEPGGIFDVTFRKVTVTGRQVTYDPSRVVETPSLSLIAGDDGFRIERVAFEDVTIGNVPLTESNRDSYFQIDRATTAEIVFSDSGPAVPELSPVIKVCADAGTFGCARFPGVWGVVYRAEVSEDLVNWTELDQAFYGMDGPIEVTVPITEDGNPVFVRLRAEGS